MATTTAAAPAGTCGSTLYDTPVDDIACAMAHSDKNVDLMSKCCKDADVISYYDKCGVYCLALGQSAKDLTDCLHEAGAEYGQVFCRDDDGKKESSTATGAKPKETADTSVEKEGKDGGGEDGDKDGDDDEEGAAAIARPQHTTLAGVVVGTLLFTATAFGGMLI